MKLAFSYIRFSTAHQEQGESLARQLDDSVRYAQKYGFTLDDSLQLRDLGVSGYRGKNAAVGALSKFLSAVAAKQIPQGSALLVESLDRISRQEPWTVVRLLVSLREAGVEVHLIDSNKVLYPEGASGDRPLKVTDVGVLAERAHEESNTKSRRLADAFARKREKIKKGEVKFWSPAAPWWITVIGTGKERSYAIPDDRRKVLEKLFRLVAQGMGPRLVARQLNLDGDRTWRRTYQRGPDGKTLRKDGKAVWNPSLWTENRVRETVKNDAVLGTLKATAKTKAKPKAKTDAQTETPDKAYAIPGFYPAPFSNPKIVHEARAAIAARWKTGRHHNDGPRPVNLFRRLLRFRGYWMRHSTRQNGTRNPKTNERGFHGYYECLDPAGVRGSRLLFTISEAQLEPVIVAGLVELAGTEILAPGIGAKSEAPAIEKQLRRLEKQKTNLLDALQAGHVSSADVADRLPPLKAAIERARDKLAHARLADAKARNRIQVPEEISNATIARLSNNDHRQTLATAISRIVRRIHVARQWKDLPITTAFLQGTADVLTESKSHHFPDPVPDTRRRKELWILIEFTNGALRMIGRTESNTGTLITHRVDVKAYEAKFERELAAWQKAHPDEEY